MIQNSVILVFYYVGLSTDEYVNFSGSLSTDKNIKSSFSASSFLVIQGV